MRQDVDDEQLETAEETAPRLGLSVERLYRLSAQGVVPRVVIGRLVRFSPKAISAFIASGGRSFELSDEQGLATRRCRRQKPDQNAAIA